MAEVLKKFGRYFLLDQIAQGGMAEIYRARLATIDSSGRLLVIKKIQAGFGNNTEFLQMFRSEIKVTMGFNHPNIVQVYDFGEEQEKPFIAMEWVDGKNLRQFLVRFAQNKSAFPVDLAVFIIEQAAGGIHYAHAFRDKLSGQPLNIVHRDISPQNILIAFEGSVKVIDFGIAKATTNSESTRAGIIKGKPSYLSPEQISGEPIDGRCDIFALGTVLWELLTGTKLFAGENDLAVLKLIESSTSHVKVPSILNPKVPVELDQIVMKALKKDRNERYQTAEELQRALHKFLYTFNPDYNPQDLAYFAKDLFKNDIVEDRKKLSRTNDRAEALLQAESVHAASSSHSQHKFKSEGDKDDTTTVVEKLSRVGMPTIDLKTDPNLVKALEFDPISKRKAGIMDADSSQKQSIPFTQGAGQKTKSYAEFKKQKENEKVKTPTPAWFKKLVAAAVLVFVLGPLGGLEKARQILLDKKSELESSQVRNPTSLSKSPDSGEGKIGLKLSITPTATGTTVQINGNRVDASDPNIVVGMDSAIEVSVKRPGYRDYAKAFVIDSHEFAGKKEYVVDVPLVPVKYGLLTVKTLLNVTVKVPFDGVMAPLSPPYTESKVPVGTYNIIIHSEALQLDQEATVTIKENQPPFIVTPTF